jgi:hypothetical protein
MLSLRKLSNFSSSISRIEIDEQTNKKQAKYTLPE